MNPEANAIFKDLRQHLLEDEIPSKYLDNCIVHSRLDEYPFSMLSRLTDTKQSQVYHKEGNAFAHTCMVVDMAAKIKSYSNDKETLMWSALLHDIGKPDTTAIRKGRITSYNHDKVGANLAKEFLEYFNCDEGLVERVSSMVRYHMHLLYVLKDLPFKNIKKMSEEVDVYELALLGYCDKMGRTGSEHDKELEFVNEFLYKVKGKDLIKLNID